jgi:hypothetical protein
MLKALMSLPRAQVTLMAELCALLAGFQVRAPAEMTAKRVQISLSLSFVIASLYPFLKLAHVLT